ncbi:protein MULTIPLE CHLOROPLAST DIVISION SITE 1 isoform X2 [Malus sylvestris]|uniref:protein MULTIPLE CHLOROPLAST DIVISION SITE 1 isoform X1 n=1 Tax=Malus sylvestris TaxID=3752 RepID=UPI0021AC2357|nr:protein MULTIPLE CHLOROPLAST DIVISION SITE 1 isoform X1 [Malus sylvestris]XP_050151674.1 protein MULTIPLE CHLOROPLAST DIVISION SITE 1 isoform X2 [Malus sylvestris]
MASISSLQFQLLSFQPSIWGSNSNHRTPSLLLKLRPEFGRVRGLKSSERFPLRAIDGSVGSAGDDHTSPNGEVAKTENKITITNLKDSIGKLQGMISSVTPLVFSMRQREGFDLAIGLCIATAFVVIAVRVFVVRKSKYDRPGSVADLVRRGQLRSDRRGISTPLKYDDPFNNPLVKLGKGNSTVEMCGKVYRLAPVTLTKEQQVVHQKRRSRAYQWKRPTIFLKEGDSIPPDVDPDTVRWIPANHPFATTVGDIDEDLAQNNVYQKHGVPFRIQAEHEALQREQKLNRLVNDSSDDSDFTNAFKSGPKSPDRGEESRINKQSGNFNPPLSERAPNSSRSVPPYEEMHD